MRAIEALVALARHNRWTTLTAFHEAFEALHHEAGFGFVRGVAVDAMLIENGVYAGIIGGAGRAERE
jgi:hypothetical protein